MKPTFLFLLTLILSLPVLAQNGQTGMMASIPIFSGTSEYVVLPNMGNGPPTFRGLKDAPLTKKEVSKLEKILKTCMANYNSEIEKDKTPGSMLRNFKTYNRQYIAVVNQNGETEVWANCLCDVYRSGWKKQSVAVKDGGTCFFNVLINLVTGKYMDLYVNSEA